MSGDPNNRTARVALAAIAVLVALLVPSLGQWAGDMRIAILAAASIVALGAAVLVLQRAFLARHDPSPRFDRASAVLASLCLLGLGAILFSINLDHYVEGVVAQETTPPLPPEKPEEPNKAGAAASAVNAGQPAAAPRREVDPGRAIDDLFQQARQALQRGEFEEAADGFRETIAQAEAHGALSAKLNGSIGLAECLLLQKKGDEALDVIERAQGWGREVAGDPPEGLVRLLALEGTVRVQDQGLPEAGIPQYEEALQLARRHHAENLELRDVVLRPLVDALAISGDRTGAIALAEAHVNEIVPNESVTEEYKAGWCDLTGRLLGANGQYEESIPLFEKAIELLESKPDTEPLKIAFVRHLLALSMMKTGKKNAARQEIRKALDVVQGQLEPDHEGRQAIEKLADEIGS